MSKVSLLLLVGVLASCTAPQRPYQFSMHSEKSQAMPQLRAALAEQGHETEYIDDQAGIIRTRWMDTGFMMGQVQGQTATVVRRYTVVLVTQPDGSLSLTLRADTKKCAQYGFEFAGEMVTGACESMNELAGPHQEELNVLGSQLQARINPGQPQA